jgi:hypothetical protein
VAKVTPTERLKISIEELRYQNNTLFNRIKTLEAENAVYKEVFAMHFKQGIPSLVKALRTTICSLQQIIASVKGR